MCVLQAFSASRKNLSEKKCLIFLDSELISSFQPLFLQFRGLVKHGHGGGGLSNVYVTTTYIVNMSTEGGGVKNIQNLVCVVCV